MKNREKPWKTIKNQPGTMKKHEKPWKTMKNHEKPWKTMKNQPGTMKNHEKQTWNHEKVLIFRDQRGVTTDLHVEWESAHFLWPTRGHNWPSCGMRKCSFFVTNAGSQLMEWESAHFSWPTRGHNWPFRCLDFSWPTLGHNWPFRCLDCIKWIWPVKKECALVRYTIIY